MPPLDPFRDFTESALGGPSRRWATITPSNDTDLAKMPKAIRCNGAGDVVMIGSDGVSATFTFGARETLLVQPSRIMATGTTATGIVGLY